MYVVEEGRKAEVRAANRSSLGGENKNTHQQTQSGLGIGQRQKESFFCLCFLLGTNPYFFFYDGPSQDICGGWKLFTFRVAQGERKKATTRIRRSDGLVRLWPCTRAIKSGQQECSTFRHGNRRKKQKRKLILLTLLLDFHVDSSWVRTTRTTHPVSSSWIWFWQWSTSSPNCPQCTKCACLTSTRN